MLIRCGFDIRFETQVPVPMLALLSVRPERQAQLRSPEVLATDPGVPVRQYIDPFGNVCSRFTVPAGGITLRSDFVIEDTGLPDAVAPDAPQHPVEDLPYDVLQFLMSSRYCEVSLLANEAWDLAKAHRSGWARVQALVDAAHERIEFDYMKANSERTARSAFDERFGVCRDFAHLAITLCRAINVPARYCTGYLGDIGIAPVDAPMDFSAWFEAYLGGRWYTFDARHNTPRIARIVMARGRDATDAALTTAFGSAKLVRFDVHTDEVASIDLSRPPGETALPQRSA
ncbi:transglutaminase family protein [Erythrobacter arachoides]|uniref:Transglutaminase family protein n=1 Tax=Aurantiacibacter arachoides TaxID=1850444 RepID=A0A845A400_9SPHN|nr:transglutaminase family protein [Aurantiacibacter arachoides]MXO94380.1 transglutaminase family protein [Aurantiacibacter arachoides]GGD63925.1 transglutaminase [Aurantiacibacter arachoides]